MSESDATEVTDEGQQPSLLSALLPYLAGAVLAAVVVTVLLLSVLPRYIPSLAPAVSVEVVSFDVVRFTNAQRAVAAAFLTPSNDLSQANDLLLKLPERTRDAIAQVAGPGALVVLKQAVVQGQTRDITVEVLTILGLPTNVPTADAVAYNLDMAPTMWQGSAVRAASAASAARAPAAPQSGVAVQLP